MGLDLEHYKATREKTHTVILVDRLEAGNVPPGWFASYIQAVPQPVVCQQLLLIDPEKLRQLRKYLPDDPLLAAFPGKDKQVVFMDPDDQNVSGIARDFLAQRPAWLEVRREYRSDHGSRTYTLLSLGQMYDFPGVYFDSVGEQRNGMLSEFELMFPQKQFYYRRDVLQRMLADFVRPEMRAHFSRYFVDNFEEGCSLVDYCA